MRTLEISKETYEKIKDQLGQEDAELSDYDDLIGKKFFFRAVTYHLVGKVESRMGSFIRLSCASWIASSGRFMQAIKDGELDEVEPVGVAYLNLQTVVDFFPWSHPLPKEQK